MIEESGIVILKTLLLSSSAGIMQEPASSQCGYSLNQDSLSLLISIPASMAVYF